jgi:hypothetical protein
MMLGYFRLPAVSNSSSPDRKATDVSRPIKKAKSTHLRRGLGIPPRSFRDGANALQNATVPVGDRAPETCSGGKQNAQLDCYPNGKKTAKSLVSQVLGSVGKQPKVIQENQVIDSDSNAQDVPTPKRTLSVARQSNDQASPNIQTSPTYDEKDQTYSPPPSSRDSLQEPKRNRGVLPRVSPVGCKYACPYYQRNPEKYYDIKPCFSASFPTIHRLK